MNFSRREILKGMGAAGLTPLLIGGCDSSSSGGLPPLPELPEYEWTGPIGPESLFEHGVASGDPLTDGVIIWTRVTPEQDGPVEVWWEMALDEDFVDRTVQGTFLTDSDRDYTVKVDVSGLVWGRSYFYRFAVQGRWSPTGRTRLTPQSGDVSKLRFGVCSCANYAFGFFHGFRRLAERSDLDAVVHLGDYFYEYGDDTYPDGSEAQPKLRMLEPSWETVTLDDYRTRLSLYHRDPDLQECHRQHPFIVIWDDHETANNSWMGGAENHQPETEGSWTDRVAASKQAFFEWLPIRDNSDRQIYRTIRYGDLADLIMLDTRLEGREEQFASDSFVPDEPNLPKNIISADQEAWLREQLSNSTAKWRILGNQVVMSFWQFTNSQTGQADAYANSDQWNGYLEGRNRLLGFMRDNDISNTVVITGDVHSSWAMDVTLGDGSYDPQTRAGAICGEFVTSAITSPQDGGEALANVFKKAPHVRYAEATLRGYLVLDIQPDKAQADWYLLDGIGPNDGAESLDASWAILDGQKHLTEMDGPEASNPDAPGAAS